MASLALAGCEQQERDGRPVSDDAALSESLRALPGVEEVEEGDGAEGGTAFTAVLAPDAGEAELRTTGKRSHALMSDYRYPSGEPSVTVEYGRFSAEILSTHRPPGSVCADGCGPNRLDLTDFLDLSLLPPVASGSLTQRGASVELHAETDPRLWLEKALATDARLLLHVSTEREDGDGDVDGTAEAGGEQNTAERGSEDEWFALDLGADQTRQAVAALFDAVDASGAEVVEATSVQNLQYPSGTLRVTGPADIAGVDEALRAQFPEAALSGFEVLTEEGLEVRLDQTGSPIDDVLDAHRLLTDAGTAVTRIGGGGSYLELVAAEPDTLRRTAALLSGDAWPLPADTAVRIRREEGNVRQASFSAGEWDERAPLLSDLWEAGFTQVEYRDDYGDLSTALVIGPERDYRTPQARDALVRTLRAADWEGAARITLDADAEPSFTTTVDGRAQDPVNLAEDAGPELSGWGRAFVDAWDASAP